MAPPTKKREIDQEVNHKDNQDDEHLNDNEPDIEEDVNQGMQIEVEFEGRRPEDQDFDGIKLFLRQLLLKNHVDLGGLTDLIISQNYIGSVVKQADDEPSSDDEDDDRMDLFGITTMINLTKRDQNCIKQLHELLLQLASEHADDQTNSKIKSVLENEAVQVGLIINERFINIPSQISVPLMENLVNEVQRAVNKKLPFDFQYLILICKLYKKNKEKNSSGQEEMTFNNPEEEIFSEEADCSFEFSVEKDSDLGLSGKWEEDSDTMIPYRRVLLFEASKLTQIIDKIKENLNGPRE